MAKVLGVSILNASRYTRKFNEYYKTFHKTDNYRSMVACMSGMYTVLKQYGTKSFNQEPTVLYDRLLDKAMDCEDELMNYFVVESNPYFEYDDQYLARTKFAKLNDEEKLDYIVWTTRRELLDRLHKEDKSITSLNGLHLQNECKETSYSIKALCDKLKIKSKVVKIPAGFSEELKIFNGNGFHYFVLVTINKKEYIVDCTYRQFFRASNNNLHRLGVVGLSGCGAGTFMLMSPERKKVALDLLKNGWISCTDENFKHYLDGFMMSYRNALYYEWLGQVDYSVGYTIQDYIEFLNGEDLISKYEPKEGLGRQDQPLTNTKIKFI